MTTTRHLTPDPVPMGPTERRTYFYDPSAFGGATPSAVTMTVIDTLTGQDVSSTTTTGSITPAATPFAYKSLGNLLSGHVYRVDLTFTVGVNVYTQYFLQAVSDV